MKNTVWYKINPESKSIDILRDKDFLRLLRVFVLEFEPNYKDKKLDNLKNQFSKKDFLTIFNEKNDYNLFNQIIAFLSDDFVKPIFFEYLENYNIDEKYLNLFLEVGNFLEKIYIDSKEYPEWFYNVSDKYKTNITDILWEKQLEDAQYKLLQIWYPVISPYWFAIIEADIDNSFTKRSVLWWEEIYIYCRDNQNNIFYMNYLWELLKDWKDKIIKEINTKEIKTFWKFKVFKFINEDNKNKIWIISHIWIWKILEIEADNFNIQKFSYTEDALWDDWKEIYDKTETIELLYISSDDETYYLDENINKLSLLELFRFINKNNPLLIDDIEKRLDKFSEVDVKNIYKISSYEWLKFIELEVETETFIDEYWNRDYETNHCVMMENWKALIDKWEFWNAYIRNLGEKKTFLENYEFVSFDLTDFSDTDWFIDSFWNVVNIDGKRLVSLEKRFTVSDWREYYVLNNNWKKLYKKEFILRELSAYSSFKDIWTEFDIVMENNEYIEINKDRYNKITGIVKDNWKVKFYIYKNNFKKEVEYKFLLENLQSSNTWKEALRMLNKTLAEFERIWLI